MSISNNLKNIESMLIFSFVLIIYLFSIPKIWSKQLICLFKDEQANILASDSKLWVSACSSGQFFQVNKLFSDSNSMIN